MVEATNDKTKAAQSYRDAILALGAALIEGGVFDSSARVVEIGFTYVEMGGSWGWVSCLPRRAEFLPEAKAALFNEAERAGEELLNILLQSGEVSATARYYRLTLTVNQNRRNLLPAKLAVRETNRP